MRKERKILSETILPIPGGLPVFYRGTMHIFAEHPVKIADIAVPAVQGDGAYRRVALQKQIAGYADAVVIQVFDQGHIDLRFKKPAELALAHMELPGEPAQGKGSGIIAADELEHILREGGAGINVSAGGQESGCGILTQNVPDVQKPGLDEQLIAVRFCKVQSANVVQRRAQQAADGFFGVKMIPEEKPAGGLGAYIFLLDIIVPVTADQLQSEIHCIKVKGTARLCGDKMEIPGMDEQNIPRTYLESSAVYKGAALSFEDDEQLIFFVPVGADALRPGRIGGIFMYL